MRVRLNKNLANYPLARDARVPVEWRRGKTSGRWQADLPGDNRIQLRLPAKTPKALRRAPTAFDINVLAVLLAEVWLTDSTRIEFESVAALLRLLDRNPQHNNRLALESSLQFWERLSLRYVQWYLPGRQGSPGSHARRVLPPPIKSTEFNGRRLVVRVRAEWVKLAGLYFVPLPLPLPATARVQNVVLLALARGFRKLDHMQGRHFRFGKNTANLAGKLGITYRDKRNRGIELALAEADKWLSERGWGMVAWQKRNGKYRFAAIAEVAAPRKRKSAT